MKKETPPLSKQWENSHVPLGYDMIAATNVVLCDITYRPHELGVLCIRQVFTSVSPPPPRAPPPPPCMLDANIPHKHWHVVKKLLIIDRFKNVRLPCASGLCIEDAIGSGI